MFNQFTLGYPNKEVEEGFFDFLVPIYLTTEEEATEFDIRTFVEDVLEGRLKAFMTRLSSLLAGIPHYGPTDSFESRFQNALYILFMLLGFYTRIGAQRVDARPFIGVCRHGGDIRGG